QPGSSRRGRWAVYAPGRIGPRGDLLLADAHLPLRRLVPADADHRPVDALLADARVRDVRGRRLGDRGADAKLVPPTESPGHARGREPARIAPRKFAPHAARQIVFDGAVQPVAR